MEKVIVLGLPGCSHCKALIEGLDNKGILYKLLDADDNSQLADRMESLLKTNEYPIVIVEGTRGSTYLYRVDSYEEAKSSPVAYATKIGCVSIDSMIEQIKKYNK
jgi:glutaredoxin